MVVVIRMRGLPFESSSREIRNFFGGLEIKEEDIHLIPNENGKASGVAFAVFHDDDDARKAMLRDGRYLGKRYVNLFLSSLQEMQKFLREGVFERGKRGGRKRTNKGKGFNQKGVKVDSAQTHGEEMECDERISRSQREIRHSVSDRCRSRSPFRSHDHGGVQSRPNEAETRGIARTTQQMRLIEFEETQREYEEGKKMALLAALSDYEKNKLEEQFLAAEAKNNKNLDLRYLLTSQQSPTARLPRNPTTNQWEHALDYESNPSRVMSGDFKDDHLRVVELINQNQNTESLIHSAGYDVALGGVNVVHDSYQGEIKKIQDNYPVGITGNYNYTRESFGEIPYQNLGQEKVFIGDSYFFGHDFEKQTKSHDQSTPVRAQERHDIRFERMDDRYKYENERREKDDQIYKRFQQVDDQGREEGSEGPSYASNHKSVLENEKLSNRGNPSRQRNHRNRRVHSNYKSGIKKDDKHQDVSQKLIDQRDDKYTREKRFGSYGPDNKRYEVTTLRGQGSAPERYQKVDENDGCRGLCINMIGLPYLCTEKEVEMFFQGLRVKYVHRCRNLSGTHMGKTNGEAFVVFESLEDCSEAVERDHQLIRGRFVKVRKSPKEVMYDVIQQEDKILGKEPQNCPSRKDDINDLNQVQNTQMKSGLTSEMQPGSKLPAFDHNIYQPGPSTLQPAIHSHNSETLSQDVVVSQLAQGANIDVNDIKAGCVVGIRNLPSTVTADEILDFFYGFRIIPESIRIHYLAPGRSSGDAVVTFIDEKEARIAMQQLNHKPVGRRNVQLFPI